jgi:glucose 1-dehydrogenase
MTAAHDTADDDPTPGAGEMMRAIAVRPGVAGSIHARTVRRPVVDDIPDGRGVLVQVIRVGLCGTDREISHALYGTAPDGDDYLVLGHENLGRVVATGPNVPPELRPGTLVVSTVRRPGHSPFDVLGMQDFTTDTTYYERGISKRHGYLSELYVEDATFVVSLPPTLEGVGVLMEPLTVAEKGVNQAYEIQRRLRIWRPARALVIGAGTIGLLASLVLRLDGIDVTVFSRRKAPYLNSDLAEAIGCRYASSSDTDIAAVAAANGPFDVILEASGFSPLAFEAAASLGINGVLILAGVTGGEHLVQIDANRINQGFVLGNKVMVGTVNASRDDYVRGVDHLLAAEATHPGWLGRLMTTPVAGLEDPAAVIEALDAPDVIKAYVNVAVPADGTR